MLRRIATAAIAAVLLAASAATYAATRTWSGATSTNWGTASNWAESVVPVNGDDLVFPDSPTNRTSNNNIAGLSVASVTVTTMNSGAAYDYTGNGITLTGPITFSNPGVGSGSGDPNWAIPITLGASITMTSDGRVTPFNAAIDLGANTLTVAGGGDLWLNGIVSGTGGITKNSGSALQLFGANDYSGATLVNAGTIFARHATALGSSATGTTFANGAGLGVLSGPYTLNEPLTFQGPGNYVNAYSNIDLAGAISFAGTLTYTAYGPGVISGPVTSSGTLSKNGVDTLSTSGNWPAFTGAVNVVAGGFAPTGTFPAAVNLFAPASLYGYGTTGTPHDHRRDVRPGHRDLPVLPPRGPRLVGRAAQPDARAGHLRDRLRPDPGHGARLARRHDAGGDVGRRAADRRVVLDHRQRRRGRRGRDLHRPARGNAVHDVREHVPDHLRRRQRQRRRAHRGRPEPACASDPVHAGPRPGPAGPAARRSRARARRTPTPALTATKAPFWCNRAP
ncbi:MAG: hypothetical protein IPI87_01165 [Betaproteobacteria bacterium]|nr:hypothetical protein [Betaproteobacteria bacterium]